MGLILAVVASLLVFTSVNTRNVRPSSAYGRFVTALLDTEQNRAQSETARQRLVKSLHLYSSGEAYNKDRPFDDILMALSVPSNISFEIAGDKFIVSPQYIQTHPQEVVIYGAGIETHPEFESAMAQFGASVFAFDCTIDPNTLLKNITFKPWCYGPLQSTNTFAPLIANRLKKNLDRAMQSFHPLIDIMSMLGHSHLNVLKMDIEGYEWGIFQTELIDRAKNNISYPLPDQLLFELHVEGANYRFVPEHVVENKTRVAVNKLFLDLYHLGYRTVYKKINGADSKHCADFSLVRMQQSASHHHHKRTQHHNTTITT